MIGIVTISGFRESERQSCGMEELQAKLEALFDGQAEVYDLRQWDSDMKGLAALIDRDGIKRVVIAAYSHGLGYAAVRLAKYLKRHGITVALLLSCDGVYRPTWLPNWTIANVLSFRALTPDLASIKIPSNVEKVVGVRQVLTIPRGHPLKAEDPTETFIFAPQVLPYGHRDIDQAPEWHEMAIREISKLVDLS